MQRFAFAGPSCQRRPAASPVNLMPVTTSTLAPSLRTVTGFTWVIRTMQLGGDQLMQRLPSQVSPDGDGRGWGSVWWEALFFFPLCLVAGPGRWSGRRRRPRPSPAPLSRRRSRPAQ